MKCPKCQNEINSNAKFCTKCGCNLAVEMANAAKKSAMQTSQQVCAKCGATLTAGAMFCTKCGTPVKAEGAAKAQSSEGETVFLYDNNGNKENTDTVLLNESNVPNQQDIPIPDDIVPPDNNNKKQKKEKEPKKAKELKNTQDEKKAGAGMIIAVIILLLLVIASGVACVLVWNGTIALPFSEKKPEIETEVSTEENTDGALPEKPSVDTAELFAEPQALLAEGKNQVGNDAEVLTGMENLRNAMYQFAEKAEGAGDASIASDKIAEAYNAYVSGVIRHKDLMNGQTLSGSIYSQIMLEINDAAALAEEFASKGYTLDISTLTSTKDEFASSYKDRIIAAFDDFTNRAAWSRTEAWNLMSNTPETMFETTDLDNPLRLRYAYALSWWIQKQIETELGNGTITAKGAALKIANMIDVMDYNPMMINYYITYMKDSGEDCSEVSQAYDEMIEHIAQTQGIRIGEDIALDHFWYFNDFGTYSVDDTNGVTVENRQWIRDRMETVAFVKQ